MGKECKHLWKKINKKVFKTKATYHCNKCGVLGIATSNKNKNGE